MNKYPQLICGEHDWSICWWPLWKWGCGAGGCGKKHYFNRQSIKHKAKPGISAEVVWWLRKRACLAKLQGHLDDGRWKSDLVCVCFPVCFRELVYVQRMDGCSGLTAVTLSGVQRSFWQLASPCLSLPAWLFNTTWGSQLPWTCEGLQHPSVNWSIHLWVGKTLLLSDLACLTVSAHSSSMVTPWTLDDTQISHRCVRQECP